jgi:hypothetical protein
MRWFTRREQGSPQAASSTSQSRVSTAAPRSRSSEAEPAAVPDAGEVGAQPSEARVRPAEARGQRREAGTRPRETRRGVAWRTREAGASAVGTLGSGVILVARLVMTAAALIALLIALAIVLRDVDANQSNTIVKGIHEGANFFAGAFTGLIKFNGHPKRAITVDWGIALVVYLLVGALIASMIARVGRGGLRFERSHRVAPMP